MKHPLYTLYLMLLLGLTAAAQFRGYSLDKVNEVKNIPRSVRDNPGSYRSHYAIYTHYTGGK